MKNMKHSDSGKGLSISWCDGLRAEVGIFRPDGADEFKHIVKHILAWLKCRPSGTEASWHVGPPSLAGRPSGMVDRPTGPAIPGLSIDVPGCSLRLPGGGRPGPGEEGGQAASPEKRQDCSRYGINTRIAVYISDDEYLLAGERIWNLERLFNLKAGFSKKDDTLPPRLLKDPMPGGPHKGRVVETG